MKTILFALMTALCAGSVAAQTGMPKKPDSTMKAPSDPGMRTPPDSGMKTPSERGPVVTPPKTGNEEIVKSPSTNVDPKIDDATNSIDQKNREQSDGKPIAK